MELRKINHLESNIPILDLPNKVFGYSYGHVFRNFKNDFSNLVIQKGNPSSTELRFFFEVRKYTSTDVRLVGYISDEAQLIYSESGFKKNKIILFPFAYQEFKNRLEICLSNQSLFINDRNIESTTFGEISILEISSSTPQDNSNKVIANVKKQSFLNKLPLYLKSPLVILVAVILFCYVFYKVTGVNPKDIVPSIFK